MAETADTTATEDPILTVDYAPRNRLDMRTQATTPARHTQPTTSRITQTRKWKTGTGKAMEASSLKGTTTATQRPTALPPPTVNHEVEEVHMQHDHSDHEVDTLNWDVLEHPPDTDTKTKLDNTSQLLSSLTCERRQEYWLLCQDNCGCKNSLQNLDEKKRIFQDYGLRSGIADLILNTHIVVGEVAAIFGETSTVWDQDDVDEFDRIATQHNTTGNTQQFEFYVSRITPGNQGRFHIIPEPALSMTINPSLRHSLQKRSIWKGEGQHAKHTCCKRHQNVELQFTTIQTR